MKVVVMTSIGAAAQKDERESKVDRVVVRSMLNAGMCFVGCEGEKGRGCPPSYESECMRESVCRY
jgi:hypothetical protein